VDRAEAYLHAKFHLDPSNRLANGLIEVTLLVLTLTIKQAFSTEEIIS